MDNTLRQIIGSLFQVTAQAEDLAKQLEQAKSLIREQAEVIAALDKKIE